LVVRLTSDGEPNRYLVADAVLVVPMGLQSGGNSLVTRNAARLPRIGPFAVSGIPVEDSAGVRDSTSRERQELFDQALSQTTTRRRDLSDPALLLDLACEQIPIVPQESSPDGLKRHGAGWRLEIASPERTVTPLPLGAREGRLRVT